MTSKLLWGKTCLITGGGRGIGQAVAKALAKEGGKIAVVARSRDQLEELGAPSADVYTTDFSDGKAVDSLAQTVLTKYGAIDVLVNKAGVLIEGTRFEGDPNAWDKMIAINLSATMRLTRHLAPAMVEKGMRRLYCKGGCIINLGSVAAVELMSANCAYAATKHGLRGWSLSCYEALRYKNIKVVLINPGYVNTPMVDKTAGNVKRERMLQPDDIAEAAMLAFRMTPAAVPEEITLRLTLSPFGD